MRCLIQVKRSAVKARGQASDQLRSLIEGAPAPVRRQLASVGTAEMAAMAARLPAFPATLDEGCLVAIRSLGARWLRLDAEVCELDLQITSRLAPAPPVETTVAV